MKRSQLVLLLKAGALVLLVILLLAADLICSATALPVSIDIRNNVATLQAGSQVIRLGTLNGPLKLQFDDHDPVIHEFQLDGTDSTNNFTLDTNYLHRIASWPYYRFQAWMRDLDGLSRWRDVKISANDTIVEANPWPAYGIPLQIPSESPVHIEARLQRPETPMTLTLSEANGASLAITFNRNDRQISVSRTIPGSDPADPAITFFPLDPAPFAAQVLDFLIRTVLWALVVLAVTLILDVGIAALSWLIWKRPDNKEASSAIAALPHPRRSWLASASHVLNYRRGIFAALHPIAFIALGCSLAFVAWIAAVQYHGEPHIFDASTYLFAAKMYAMGKLSVPIPLAIDHFSGPFMVQAHGQWFGQYAPGTALTLVPGIWLGVPWLVEPLLGTLALLGIGLIAARLYDRRVATLAVLLGTLSPFYSYLAASYLSHAVALFYLVWGLWALLRFAQGGRSWSLLLSALLFGMGGLTRDLVAVLFVALVVPGVLLICWKRVRQQWRRWLIPGIGFLAIALLFVALSLEFNRQLTGNPLVTPRTLFFAGDRWGFGEGVGFYGQHTLAAGLVNLSQLLTILAIDLYGWPFYLSLAFIVIPFLTLRAKAADWFMLIVAAILTGAYTGYFYHGIYLGPRYLFETLPFLLILTARGIFTLASCSLDTAQYLRKWLTSRTTTTAAQPSPMRSPKTSIATIALIAVLIGCNLLYFMPRQIEVYSNYSGYPAGSHLNLSALYHPPMHNAIIVTGDGFLYLMVLFPLNDPLLQGDVLYANASNQNDYAELQAAYPGRTLYRLNVAQDGAVSYTKIDVNSPPLKQGN